MQQKTICFIGGGNMAQAIILGLLKAGYPADKIQLSDPNQDKRQFFSQLGVQSHQQNLDAAKQAEVILLAVKPQQIAEACQSFNNLDCSNKLIISIAAGISTTRLKALLPSAQYLVRAMPNTPALVSEGMTGLYANAQLTAEYKSFAEALFNKIGKSCWLTDEQQMHALIAASGSSPAYFFLLMEAMQQALINMDMDPQSARDLVQQSALGAAKMLIENPQTPIAQLRENVTSKGGTTAAALAVFEQQQLRTTVAQAMQACAQRSKEMEQQL